MAYTHPYASKVIVSTRLETPIPGIPYKVIIVEANIPLSKGTAGYDPTKLKSLLNFVSEMTEKMQAERAEIFYHQNNDYILYSECESDQ